MNIEDEIEIKIQNVTKEQFINLYDIMKEKYKVFSFEKTLNMIESKTSISSVRRTTYYDNNAVKINKEPIIIKKNIVNKRFINNVYDNNISITHSKEIPINNYNFDENCLIRLRERISFELNQEWRLDMTVIKIETSLDNLDLIINKFFKGYNEKNFIKKENFIDKYEIELEYINSKVNKTIFDIERNISNIMNLIGWQKNPISEIYSIITEDKINRNKSNLKLKDLCNQAKTLDKYTYFKNIYTANGYILLEKTDGERCFCCLLHNVLYLIFNNTNKNLYTKIENENINESNNFIFDCEEVDGSIYIFDILYLNKQKIFNEPYLSRLVNYTEEAKKIIKLLNIDKKISIEFKKYNIINNNFKTLIETYYLEKKDSNKIDGLMICSSDKNYFETDNWKWKSFEHNTIDFYCKLEKREGDRYLYNLYSYINFDLLNKLKIPPTEFLKIDGKPNIVNILFSPSIDEKAYIFYYNSKELDKKVIEIGKNKKLEWVLKGIREDKEFGNHFQTAEKIYTSYISPFDIELLYEKDINEKNYFADDSKHDDTKEMRIYNTKVKYELYKLFNNTNFLIDFASGRATDLIKYNTSSINNVFMIEVDQAAIYEIVERKYNLFNDRNRKINIKTKIYILNEDLKNDYLDIYDKITKKVGNITFDNSICNFALHYFAYTDKLMDNFISLLNNCIGKKSYFICTLFNGEKVKEFLLKLPNHEFKSKKYYIRLLLGEKEIELTLPFTGEELYKENLINLENFILRMKKNKFKLIEEKSFIDYDIDKSKLEKDDLQYISLYSSLIFIKN
jgi:hypothetical protein